MNILLATYWQYPHVGGISTHIQLLKDGLEKRGHRVHLLSLNNAKEFCLEGGFSEVPGELQRISESADSDFLKNYQSHRLLFEAAAKRIRFEKYDVIHAHDAVVGEILGRVSGRKIALTVHGYLAAESVSEKAVAKGSPEERYLLDIEKAALARASFAIAVDTKIKSYLKSDFGFENAEVMENFVDPLQMHASESKEELRRSLGVSPEAFLVISPRRLVEKNGVLYGAMAIKRVAEKVPGAVLICFGDGPQRTAIERYVAANGLQNSCLLAGGMPNHLVARYLQASDAVLIPSVPSEGVEEATSIAAIEGMACGKPVVASAIGGLKELIEDKKTGFLAPPFGDAELAAALLAIKDNPVLAEQIGKEAKKRVFFKHSHLSAAAKVEEMYKKALQSGAN